MSVGNSFIHSQDVMSVYATDNSYPIYGFGAKIPPTHSAPWASQNKMFDVFLHMDDLWSSLIRNFVSNLGRKQQVGAAFLHVQNMSKPVVSEVVSNCFALTGDFFQPQVDGASNQTIGQRHLVHCNMYEKLRCGGDAQGIPPCPSSMSLAWAFISRSTWVAQPWLMPFSDIA